MGIEDRLINQVGDSVASVKSSEEDVNFRNDSIEYIDMKKKRRECERWSKYIYSRPWALVAQAKQKKLFAWFAVSRRNVCLVCLFTCRLEGGGFGCLWW